MTPSRSGASWPHAIHPQSPAGHSRAGGGFALDHPTSYGFAAMLNGVIMADATSHRPPLDNPHQLT